jgi:hypothetical protein
VFPAPMTRIIRLAINRSTTRPNDCGLVVMMI